MIFFSCHSIPLLVYSNSKVNDRSVTYIFFWIDKVERNSQNLSTRNSFPRKSRKDRKEAILDAAFLIWGKSNFTTTSLTPIANHLGITKAAIYKHFRSKEELLRNMEERFVQRYVAFHEEFFREAAGADISTAVYIFMKKVLQFYQGNIYFYTYFIMWMIESRFTDRPEVQSVLAMQKELFYPLFTEAGINEKDVNIEDRIHFLYIFTTFWLSTLFLDQENCDSVPQKPLPPLTTDEKTEMALKRWHRYCMEGIAVPGSTQTLSYHEIEKRLTFPPKPPREHDKIFTAIIEVSAEVGLRNASVERIAEKLGMSKSSLYSHFRNKKSMFESLLKEEQQFILGVIKGKIPSLPGFPEQSYGFMYITALCKIQNPSLLSVFNWFRFQNIHTTVKPPSRSFMKEYFAFFLNAFQKGEVACSPEDVLPSAVLLHILTFRLLTDEDQSNQLSSLLCQKLRNFHRLYLYGIRTRTLEGSEYIQKRG